MGADKNSSSKSSAYVPIATPRVTHKQAEGSTHVSRDPRTRIEKLGHKMEATANKTEQNRTLQQPTGTYDQEVRTSGPRPRLNRRYCQNFWPPSRTYNLWVGTSWTAQKKRPWVNSKLSIDGSPKLVGSLRRNFGEMMNTPRRGYTPKNFSPYLPKTPGIANPCQEHYELGFI
jgi:hypothetical protein